MASIRDCPYEGALCLGVTLLLPFPIGPHFKMPLTTNYLFYKTCLLYHHPDMLDPDCWPPLLVNLKSQQSSIWPEIMKGSVKLFFLSLSLQPPWLYSYLMRCVVVSYMKYSFQMTKLERLWFPGLYSLYCPKVNFHRFPFWFDHIFSFFFLDKFVKDLIEKMYNI